MGLDPSPPPLILTQAHTHLADEGSGVEEIRTHRRHRHTDKDRDRDSDTDKLKLTNTLLTCVPEYFSGIWGSYD